MRDQLKFYHVYLALVFVCLLNACSNKVSAQQVEKNRARIAIEYVKIMNTEIFFDIKVGARVNKKSVRISDIELTVSNEFEDEELELGKVTTNMDGESRFVLKGLDAIKPDSTNSYTVVVSFKGNDLYKKASKSISFKDAIIQAKMVAKDSVNYMVASLQDATTHSPIPGQNLQIQVERLFRPLVLGDPFNKTDEDGSIRVPIEDNIPGVDGNLTLEVVLLEHDDYGTIKAIVNAPIGVPFVEESTFDERTMWSPRNKTPLFLLIFPNLITLGMWAFIVYLTINLFRIVKS